MAPTPKLKYRMTIDRRGGTQAWSTSFHLDTAVPDLTTFEDLADALHTGVGATLESCLYPNVSFVGCDYYPAGSDVALYSKPLSGDGTKTVGSDEECTSDSVALWRWTTAARTSKNHPVYLFNYVHGVYKQGTGPGDDISTSQKTAMDAFITRLVSGVTIDGTTFHRAGPNGAVATGGSTESYVRHRDFPK